MSSCGAIRRQKVFVGTVAIDWHLYLGKSYSLMPELPNLSGRASHISDLHSQAPVYYEPPPTQKSPV